MKHDEAGNCLLPDKGCLECYKMAELLFAGTYLRTKLRAVRPEKLPEKVFPAPSALSYIRPPPPPWLCASLETQILPCF
jgi:hypothetical protein